LIAAEEQIATVDLERGVPVTIDLSSHPDSQKDFNDKVVSVAMFPAVGGSSEPQSIRHRFAIRDGAVRFTAYPIEYQSLRLKMDEYFVTPNLLNHSVFRTPDLDLSDGKPSVFKLTLHPKVRARGRVLDAKGNGVAGAWVSSSIANDPRRGLSKMGSSSESIRESLGNWSSGGSAETDREGRYEIEVARGLVSLEVVRKGFFSASAATETIVANPSGNMLPDLKVLKVPKLKGKVIDGEGRPVGGAIVQMRYNGRGGARPISQSGPDGRFELALSRVPYKMNESQLQTDVFVVAIDPKSNLGGLAKVDLLSPETTSQINVALAPRTPDWALNVISRDPIQVEDANEDPAKSMAGRFPAGVVGMEPPDLSEGTWLNSNATSLKDLRGKFVLLDFWFIGCGPCKSEEPTIQLLHEKFAHRGFTVVSVHKQGQTVEAVRKYAETNGMTYPIVVDNTEGEITKQYKPLGVYLYPMYMLLGPDGKIIRSDATSDGPRTLRGDKVELIYRELLERIQ
ncbi:MAG: TlpA disulfide reductase family protein, partial [Planctomycetota bacterium]